MLWLLSILIKGEIQVNNSAKKEKTMIRKKRKLFDLKTFKLSNGLEVIFIPNKVAPTASIGVLYRYGTADDEPTTAGLAHFLEHMMFKGTKAYPKGTFDDEIMRAGGIYNAYTSWDLTFYYASVPKKSLEKILELESDRMINLDFDDEEVEPEKSAVLAEEDLHVKNHPFGETIKIWLKTLFPLHPYGTEILGDPTNIKIYNSKNTRETYKKWYAPNNAVLVISGNFETGGIKTVVKKYFDKLRPSAHIPEKRKRLEEPNLQGMTRTLIDENKRSSMVIIQLAYKTPSLRELKSTKKLMAYSVASYMLGGNDMSLFYKELVRKNKWATNVYTATQNGLDPMHFKFTFELAKDMSVSILIEQYKRYLKEISETHMHQNWFENRLHEVKNQIIGQMVFETDGTLGAVTLFDDCAKGFSSEDINTITQAIDDVTLDDVKDVIREFVKAPSAALIIHPPGYDKSELSFDWDF